MSQESTSQGSTQCISSRLSAILKAGTLTKRKLSSDYRIRSFSLRSNRSSDENDPVQSMLQIFYLPDFCAYLVAKVLEDTLIELHILENCSAHLDLVKLQADMPKLLAEKFGVEQPPCTDELEGIDRKDLARDEYKIYKLANDRQFLHEAVFQTILDLCMNRCFESLARPIAFFYDRDTYYDNLVREEAQNRILRRELTRQLRSQRIHNASIHYTLDAAIDRLTSEIEDSNIVTEVRSRYMSKWQDSREEQHYQTIEDTEGTSLHSVVEHKVKLQDEHRAHAEVMRLMEISIDDLMRKVDRAMTKYDRNIEHIDLRIQIMKNNHQNQLDERVQLQETFAEHEKDMSAWVTFKREREEARLYRLKMNDAAFVVQAWWRGILVRQQLGPYKVKKGRKAKK